MPIICYLTQRFLFVAPPLKPFERKEMEDCLFPIQEVFYVLQDLFPKIAFPQLRMLRTSSDLRRRQYCHLDNDKIQLSDTLIRSYEDVSYGCYFGLEDNTYLGLATFDKETKR